MKRFIIYRCPEKCSCHERLKEHVLIGVSVGNDIEDIDVINDIKSQIKDDITSLVPEPFSTGTLEIISINNEDNSRRYKLSLNVLFIPDNPLAPKNAQREYGLCVKDANEA